MQNITDTKIIQIDQSTALSDICAPLTLGN